MEQEDAIGALMLLHDPVRLRLYRFVRSAPGPVTREEAAKEVRVSPKLAAFHLDKLAEAGLLSADYEVPRGIRRRVGRAPKRYRPSTLELSMSLPPRRYDLVGEILVDAVGTTPPKGDALATATGVAYDRGHEIGTLRRQELRRGRLGSERAIAEAQTILEELGYEPVDEQQDVVLRNCPFHSLARRSPQVVCALNVAFVDGLLRGLGNTTLCADLEPKEGLCCVRLRTPRRTG